MKWISKAEIKAWAGTRNCQEELPKVIRMLIRATTTRIELLSFPSGDSIHHSGLDGYLETSDVVENIPKGKSVWEVGTQANSIKSKADKEYKSRLRNPLGYKPIETTFVFVTPHLWKNRQKWIDQKKKEKKWADVRVINSEILEQWLERAPAVAQYLASNLRDIPLDQVQTPETFWRNWSTSVDEKIRLNHHILLGGRESAKEFITQNHKIPSIYYINSKSKSESTAFIIASLLDSESTKDLLFTSTLIIRGRDAYRSIVNTKDQLILILNFQEENEEFKEAVRNGYVVYVPSGTPSAQSNKNFSINLGELHRGKFIDALVKSGFSRQKAEFLSKETARNLTVLRRQIGLTSDTPRWLVKSNLKIIIPSIIAGSWDEDNANDIQIIEELCGLQYQEFSKALQIISEDESSPIIKIGSIWRIESMLDSWTYIFRYLGKEDFNNFKSSFIKVWMEVDPAFELETENRFMANILGKQKKYSSSLKKGLSDSLALVSIISNDINQNGFSNKQAWIDEIVYSLLQSSEDDFWKSIAYGLIQLAEAAPNAFLNSIEAKLVKDSSPLQCLFEEEPNPIMGMHSHHSGLLWALESLAWQEEFLSRSSLILSFLAQNDPGGTLGNRPINSLIEIFKPWHFQTWASKEDRFSVLQLIAKKYPKVAWDLFLALLPNSPSLVGTETRKPRWRLNNFDLSKEHTNEIARETNSFIVKELVKLYDHKVEKFIQLLNKTESLSPIDRDIVLNALSQTSNIGGNKIEAWNAVREFISKHRGFAYTSWALTEETLKKYDEIYENLKPKNQLDQIIWMFNKRWLEFPEVRYNDKRSIDEKQEAIDNRRILVVKEIYELGKSRQLIKLIEKGSEKRIIGMTMVQAAILDLESMVELIVQLNAVDKEFLAGISIGYLILNEIDHSQIIQIFEKLEEKGLSIELLIGMLTPIKPNQKLWDYVKKRGEYIEELYWKKQWLWFRLDDLSLVQVALKKFLQFEASECAFELVYDHKDELSSSAIIEVLKLYSMHSNRLFRLNNDYLLKEIIKVLSSRNDIEKQILLDIELLNIDILSNYSDELNLSLHNEMSVNPEFFTEVLCYAYPPENEKAIKDFEASSTKIERINSARRASLVLNNWKVIPGFKDGTFHEKILKRWVSETRKKADENYRVKYFDFQLGKLLVNFNVEEIITPPDIICEIIEEVNSISLKSSFRSALHNLNSITTRSPFDGGEIEKARANAYFKIAEELRNSFPIVSEIYHGLGDDFRKRSIEEDNEGYMRRLNH